MWFSIFIISIYLNKGFFFTLFKQGYDDNVLLTISIDNVSYTNKNKIKKRGGFWHNL